MALISRLTRSSLGGTVAVRKADLLLVCSAFDSLFVLKARIDKDK